MIIVDPLDRYFPLFGKKQEPKKKEVHGEGFQDVLDEEMKKLSTSVFPTTDTQPIPTGHETYPSLILPNEKGEIK